MAGIFSGLEKLGLGNIGGGKLFEDPKEKETAVKKDAPAPKLQLVNEEDYLFLKKYKLFDFLPCCFVFWWELF